MATSVQDIQGVFKRARAAAIACGFEQAERWTLEKGSPTNGIAWRLFLDGSSAPLPGFDGLGYLGWTRDEAYLSLRQIAQTLEAVQILNDGTSSRSLASFGEWCEAQATAAAADRGSFGHGPEAGLRHAAAEARRRAEAGG